MKLFSVVVELRKETRLERSNTNVIYIICQYFINLTVVNADGIKQIVQ
jgi:hypothetical protein